MKVRAIVLIFAGLGLMLGFQNCGGPMHITEGSISPPNKPQKLSLSGRYKVESFIATSSCPDISPEEGLVCSSIYEEEKALTLQMIEFMADGTLIIEGACNTYYSSYSFESQGGLGRLQVGELTGTSNSCDGDKAEEESLLVYRITQAVRLVEVGPKRILIFTDQSSAISLINKI